eukprot:1429660-Prymnesium_polylepis.1
MATRLYSARRGDVEDPSTILHHVACALTFHQKDSCASWGVGPHSLGTDGIRTLAVEVYP